MKAAVAELTHRNGTKSRVSVMFPNDPHWPSEYLANPDVVAVELLQTATLTLEALVRARVAVARGLASRVGSQHALWDVISEAEALLEGRETLLSYPNREEGLRRIADTLAG